MKLFMHSAACSLLSCLLSFYIAVTVASVLTVLALQVEELLLDTGQLALQGLHCGPVVILQLPQLLPVGLALGLDLRGQVCLGLGQI